MSTTTFPRVETIVVPDDIVREHIGKYASARAHEILRDVGLGTLVPRSARLVPQAERLYALVFDATEALRTQTLDIRRTNQGELPAVEQREEVAVRDQGPAVTPSASRGTKR